MQGCGGTGNCNWEKSLVSLKRKRLQGTEERHWSLSILCREVVRVSSLSPKLPGGIVINIPFHLSECGHCMLGTEEWACTPRRPPCREGIRSNWIISSSHPTLNPLKPSHQHSLISSRESVQRSPLIFRSHSATGHVSIRRGVIVRVDKWRGESHTHGGPDVPSLVLDTSHETSPLIHTPALRGRWHEPHCTDKDTTTCWENVTFPKVLQLLSARLGFRARTL